MQKPTIENLIENLKKHNDAVIVIGDKCAPSAIKINETTKDSFNRKLMVKEPEQFWKWYHKNVYTTSNDISPEEKAINELLSQDIFKMAINLNNTNHIKRSPYEGYNLIELRGNKTLIRCMSCNQVLELENFTEENIDNKVIKCDCKGKLAPSVIMFGEKYRESDLSAIKEAIFVEDGDEVKLNTHTLIFIGVDFEEDYMHELIESYNAIKLSMPEEEKCYTVMICDKDGVSIDYYQPEFATYEDIAGAVSRLTAKIKGDN